MSKSIRYGALLLVLFFLGYKFFSSAKHEKPELTYSDEEYEKELRQKTRDRLNRAKRSPASYNRRHYFPHERKDKSFSTQSARSYNEVPNEPEALQPTEPVFDEAPPIDVTDMPSRNYPVYSYVPSESSASEEKDTSGDSPTANGSVTFTSIGTNSDPLNPGTAPGPEKEDPVSSGGNNSPEADLICSASQGDGTYNSPINVSLSCSSVAEIRYCLSEGACCDPATGPVYTGPIPIGENFKSFCLSFEAEADNGKTFSSVSNGYTFNYASPDLNVSYAKLFYQTSQLYSEMSVSSNDFGKSNHFAGVINLRSRNPGVSGENLTCDEIITDHPTYTLPSVATIYPYTDVSGVSSSSQINLFMTLPELEYGPNYLTSYMVNVDLDMKTCRTGMVTLEDFPYFQAEISHGETGTQFVREFSGAFTPYGFFEPAATVSRGPAGSSVNSSPSYELRHGMFGIFY